MINKNILKFRLDISPINSNIFTMASFEGFLPSNYEVGSAGDQYYIYINIKCLDRNQEIHRVHQELDRYFFFTNIKIRADLVTPGYSNILTDSFRTLGRLPEDAGPQKWTDDVLPTQLRLWAIALENDNLVFQTLMFFQIIELSNPIFKKYSNPGQPPDPLTECRLFRDWTVHAGGVDRKPLKAYCAHLGIAEKMYNPKQNSSYPFLYEKLRLLEFHAKKTIESSINYVG